MNEKQETVADIVAEMRIFKCRNLETGELELCNSIANYLADRIEAAHKREIESITPKPDPDWKNICAKCMEGEIEPKHCEYYGEPNGCSSPIYGKHPTAEKTSVVGNSAKMREALLEVTRQIEPIVKYMHPNKAEHIGLTTVFAACEPIYKIAKAALAAPPRNCDRFNTLEDALAGWREVSPAESGPFDNWLFAEAKGDMK